MTTTQGRRKHGACLFRLRENCPFRKLRKNKCHDVHTNPTPTGGHWTTSNEQPSVSAAVTRDSVIHEQHLSTAHPDRGTHRHVVNADDMDTDPVVRPGPSFPAHLAAPLPAMAPVAASNPCVRHRDPSEDSSDASMELDSGVDPETGERALG